MGIRFVIIATSPRCDLLKMEFNMKLNQSVAHFLEGNEENQVTMWSSYMSVTAKVLLLFFQVAKLPEVSCNFSFWRETPEGR